MGAFIQNRSSPHLPRRAIATAIARMGRDGALPCLGKTQTSSAYSAQEQTAAFSHSATSPAVFSSTYHFVPASETANWHLIGTGCAN